MKRPDSTQTRHSHHQIGPPVVTWESGTFVGIVTRNVAVQCEVSGNL